MKVLFINNDGGGFADYVAVPFNTNVQTFFNERLPERNASGYLIRVTEPTRVDTARN